MMTLGGMAAAVGLVIDDAVVMLEHMVRRMQEHGTAKAATLLDAAAEMGKPLLGSTTATIVVFTPLAFISGVTGGFFKSLAVTMVACLVVSLLYPTLELTVPLFLGTGGIDQDTPPRMQAALVRDMCAAGTRVTSVLYPDLNHREVVPFSPQDSIPFLRAAFAGEELAGNCDALPFSMNR